MNLEIRVKVRGMPGQPRAQIVHCDMGLPLVSEVFAQARTVPPLTEKQRLMGVGVEYNRQPVQSEYPDSSLESS